MSNGTDVLDSVTRSADSTQSVRSRLLYILAVWAPPAALAVCTVFFLTYNISFFPYMSMDEGSHLNVPKTLVTEGEYAQKTAHGYNYYGPVVATGPTVMLPVAASFELFGVGLWQARIVSGAYIVGTLILFYAAARHLFGKTTALVTAALLLVAPGFLLTNWHEGGRIVVGEVPAMFFFLSGLLIYWKWLDQRQTWRLLAVGVLWGLAFMTKNQFPMIVVPTFIIAGLLGRYHYRVIRLRDMAIPLGIACAVFATWPIAQLLVIGGDNVANNLSTIRASSSSNYLVFSPELIKLSARFLISIEVYYGWAIPAIAYGIILSLRRTIDGFKLLLISGLIVTWLLWYLLPSIGYPRYSYPPLQLSALFLAKLFTDMIGRVDVRDLRLIRRWAMGRDLHRATHLSLILFLILIIGSPIERDIRQTLFAAPEGSPENFAMYLKQNFNEDTIIATVEYSLGLHTDLSFHYPPPHVLSSSERYYAGKDRYSVLAYDPVDYGARYLALGPHGRGIPIIYAATNIEHCWTLEKRVGLYELYKVNLGSFDCIRSRRGLLNPFPRD